MRSASSAITRRRWSVCEDDAVTGFSLKELIVDGHLGGARVGKERAAVRGCLGPSDAWGLGEVAVDRAAVRTRAASTVA